MTANREPLRVFYDGECRMCSASVAWALARDRDGALLPIPAGSSEAREATGLDAARLLEVLHTWSPESGVRAGSDAVAELLLRLPGWRWAGRTLGLPFVRPIARRVYRAVARRRRGLATTACPLPSIPTTHSPRGE